MKAYRIFYYGLMGIVFLIGLYTGSRLCFLLVLIQLFTLLAAFGLNAWTLLSFAYVQELDRKESEKGQTVRLHLAITNDKPFPFTHMQVHVQAADPADDRDLRIELPPREQAVFDLPMVLPYRGEYALGMTRVDIQDIFGLLPMHLDMRRLPYYRQRTLLVLPRLVDAGLPAGRLRADRTGTGQSPAGGQEELSHLRAFVPGDPLSRVHWKASVKTRTLLTRQLEDPTGGSCLVFLDTRPVAEDPVAGPDRLIECALALTAAHLQRRGRVRVASCAPGAQPEPLADTGPLLALRRWLALLPFAPIQAEEDPPAVRLDGSLRADAPQTVYLLGGVYDPELAQVLGSTGAPCRYLTLLPLPEGVAETEGRLRRMSLYGEELPQVLRRLLEEGAL